MNHRNRSKGRAHIRLLYLLGALALMCLGLALRRYSAALPRFWAVYAPDAVWAMMIFSGLGVLLPDSCARRTACALFFCFAIEFSQLCHTPQLDAIRATTLGYLILGQGFLVSDLVCYAAGIFLCAAVQQVLGWLLQPVRS